MRTRIQEVVELEGRLNSIDDRLKKVEGEIKREAILLALAITLFLVLIALGIVYFIRAL